MFNRSAFNRGPFNRQFTVEIYAAATLDGSGGIEAYANIIAHASGFLDGEGGLTADNIREIVTAALLSGDGGLVANNMRERHVYAELQGDGGLTANASRYHLETMTIAGEFAPGEKIVIDSHKLRVTKDGVMIGYDGDFPDLNTGTNTVVFRDEATGRDISVRITFRDKFI